MQQSTKQRFELDCKGEVDIDGPSNAKGDDGSQGGGVGLEKEKPYGNAKASSAREEEADIFFCMFALRAGRKEAGTMPSAVKGVALHGSPMWAQTCWW
jgi:hypothetical protein